MGIYTIIYTHVILFGLPYDDDFVATDLYGRTYGETAFGLNRYHELPSSWVVWLVFQP